MPKIKIMFPLGRVIRVLEATNFINTSEAAKKAKMNFKKMEGLKLEYQTNIPEATLDIIATSFNISRELLNELKDWEQKLTEHLKNVNLPDDKKELLILRALAYRLLDHYLSQTDTARNLLTIIENEPPLNQKSLQPSGLNRILKVLISINFISIKIASVITKIPRNSINYILSNKTTLRKKTLDKIIFGFNISIDLLRELQQLEQKLEVYLERQTGIKDEEKELLILQTLALKVLEHYFEEAIRYGYFPKDISSKCRRKKGRY